MQFKFLFCKLQYVSLLYIRNIHEESNNIHDKEHSHFSGILLESTNFSIIHTSLIASVSNVKFHIIKFQHYTKHYIKCCVENMQNNKLCKT